MTSDLRPIQDAYVRLITEAMQVNAELWQYAEETDMIKCMGRDRALRDVGTVVVGCGMRVGKTTYITHHLTDPAGTLVLAGSWEEKILRQSFQSDVIPIVVSSLDQAASLLPEKKAKVTLCVTERPALVTGGGLTSDLYRVLAGFPNLTQLLVLK